MTPRIAFLLLSVLSVSALLSPAPARATVDQVTTYVTIPASLPFGLDFGPNGDLYVCGQESASSGKVWRVGPGGASVTVFASGLSEPKDIAFDASGNLYVSDWVDRVQPSVIWKITPGGVKSVWATVPGATFLEFNNAGDLLVGTWGQLKIKKVTPAGVVSDFATGLGGSADEISGLAYDPTSDELYFGVGPNVKKVGPGGTPLTTIGGGMVGLYGLAREPGGKLFAARYSHRDIYSITAGGTVSLYAGIHLDVGCNDGPRLNSARFALPAGLAIQGPTLFIADQSCHAVRTIDLDGVSPAVHSTWGQLKTLYR